MPFTPFHLGPGLLIGALFRKNMDLIAILIGSVILDVESFMNLVLGNPAHGFSHTYIGATIYGLVLGYVIFALSSPLNEIRSALKLPPGNRVSIFAGALIGTWSHVILDQFLYTDLAPFWPIAGNPFTGLGFTYSHSLYFSIVAGVVGLILFIANFMRAR